MLSNICQQVNNLVTTLIVIICLLPNDQGIHGVPLSLYVLLVYSNFYGQIYRMMADKCRVEDPHNSRALLEKASQSVELAIQRISHDDDSVSCYRIKMFSFPFCSVLFAWK